ncbi:MAG: nitroreductase family protein [Tannerella sp.]|jgi:predicted oxidoreductase (fatty acid repression mutant protein)|nr:nitroreductase family protein [Tannerella sp.]
MKRSFKEAVMHRRSYYNIDRDIEDIISVSDDKIREIMEFAVLYVPSAFNSQSSRIVLLLGEDHKKLWIITKDALRKIVDPENFAATENKIDTRFATGYGTVLFYEDMDIVEGMQKSYPPYSENFPAWSQQSSGMLQFVVWTMLEDTGLGASLQHYNPLVDDEVAQTWHINPKWKLIAQMPFGNPTREPEEKTFLPVDTRVLLP